jgi:membrane protease YdiL (CAAX protease family)
VTHFFGWLLTAVVVSTICLLTLIGSKMAGATGAGPQPLNAEYVLTGEVIIGAHQLGVDAALLQPQMASLMPETLEEGLAKAILAEVILGPEAGVTSLESAEITFQDPLVPLSEDLEALLDVVSQLMLARASGEPCDPLPQEASELLGGLLPFYGPLLEAQATDDQAAFEQMASSCVQLLVILLGFGLWYLIAFLSGIAGLICIAIGVVVHNEKKKPALGLELSARTGSVYIETFGLWLLAFFGLSFLLEFTMLSTGWGESVPELNLLGSLIAMFASLFTLYWPRLRGITSAQVISQLGLNRVNVFKETLWGCVIYTTAVPLLLVGLGLSGLLGWIIEAFFGTQPAPSHPVTEMLAGSTVNLVLVYVLACVAAPIVEEIMFRGVLYRYLRELSKTSGFLISFLFSALISSFIFAAIHPQGIEFIPVLGALAVAFCIGREWRGSLIAPIVAHGLNNLVTVTLGMLLLG